MIRLALVRQRYNAYGGAERFVSRALAALQANTALEVTLIARRWDDEGDWRTRRVDPFYLTRTGRDRSFARAAAACFPDYDLVQSHERIPGAHVFRAGDGVHATWLEQLDRAQPGHARLTRRIARYHRYVLGVEAAMFRDPRLRCVICNSRTVAADIARRFGVDASRMAIIYNGIDPTLYNPALVRHREGWRASQAIDPQAPLLAYVGAGFLRKGLATALAAIVPFPEIRLAVAGPDKQLERYRRLAGRLGVGERVHFLGAVPNVRPLYGAADAFILPSLYDPFPNACAEAFASGLPVFTSPTCGAAEWVREGENGWVVDALDVTGYRDALSDWLRRRSDWPAMRAAARASAEPYTLEHMMQELTALYERLLAR